MYSHDTEAILEAFSKAYESALSNYEVAALIGKTGKEAQSISLAILALEEVGKMILIDGLLFARTGDERYQRWRKGHFSHRMKLDALELYPLFLHYLSETDPRSDDQRYKHTMVLILNDLKIRRNKLVELFGEQFQLRDLDLLKQKGFYSHEEDGRIKSCVESIDHDTAQAVLSLPWRVIDSLRFVLGNSLDKYKEQFGSLRMKVDPATLLMVREQANTIVENIFHLDVEKP